MFTLLVLFGLFITVKTSNIAEIQVQTVRRGDNVTIKCGEDLTIGNKGNLIWYKQSFGKVSQYVARTVKNDYRLNPAFKDHINVTRDQKRFDLNIAGTKEDDTATYFCAKMADNLINFGSGTLLVFQAEKTSLHVPTLKVIRSGESDTLQCSVQEMASSCAEERVYWLKHGLGESHKGIIYTHEDSSDQCKRSSEAGFPTQSCSYSFPKSQLGPDDAGIYHCAVAACGKILFGNGTKVDVKESNHWKVIVLITSNVISSIIIIVLVGVILKNRKGATNSHPSHTNQAKAENVLTYATVTLAKNPSSSRAKHSRVRTDQDIYAQVKIN
ncbi:hypothetical protein KOW79_020014 [Hemibagrus wyckioides]|uniref:Ig-like domain-containing protein n=1 Tax=Hemibagrus wyckioides TaxID=337641 RepID=A0A9D3SE56_9TELE|nr:uncharacterized protein LOC131346054 [Hemibagrus wyckioides]KAG7316473.1 hypothetical protein KOW79_020014 [Hemibagrus wyckioides]